MINSFFGLSPQVVALIAQAYAGVEESEPGVDCWELPHGLLVENLWYNSSSAVVGLDFTSTVLD